jgi:Gas vesicle protein
MERLVASTEDWKNVLDLVIDKGILFEAWVRVSLHGMQLVAIDATVHGANFALEAAAVYVGYADLGSWVELDRSRNLFPYWRRDLWTS